MKHRLWQFLNSFGEPPLWADIREPTLYADVIGDTLAEVLEITCDEIIVR